MTEPASPDAPFLLEARHLSKSFGPVEVLSDVSVGLKPGEVHAVVGENGAGKSTLMKILAGHLIPTSGTILFDGQEIHFSGPVDAERHGIVLVHQEILLAPHLTVAQNIFMGREIGNGITVNDREMNRQATAAVHGLGADIEPTAIIARLSIAQRQLIQIARALQVPHRVVIFDEPTASLTPFETEAVLNVIRDLRAKGTPVLYISHRLNEVAAIADRITVLRDGKHIATRNAAELKPVDMARLMVGRDMSHLYPDRPPPVTGEAILEVRAMNVPGYASDAAFSVKPGEILGFAGLIGAGRTELLEGVVGLRPHRGEIRLRGAPVNFRNVRESMKVGLVYLSEDRKGKGILLTRDLPTNLTLAALEHFVRGPLLDRGKEDIALDKAIGEFDIRAARKDMLAGQLSGGNQQKLLLAKMMLLDPEIIVIDEPTRGIDIGTKQQIYKFITELARRGKAVIVISSEMQELIGICHRILVMRGGNIVGEVSGDAMTEDEIVFYATGVKGHEAAIAMTGENMTETTIKARPGWSLRRIDLAAVAPFAALLALLVLGTAVSDNFLSFGNLITNVMTRSAFIAVIAIGATFVISAGGLDLSVGAMAAFIASLTIMFLNTALLGDGYTMIVASMLFAIAIGAACGLANGMISTLGRIEPFIVTLGTMGIFRGLTTWLSQGGSITMSSSQLRDLYRPVYFDAVLGIPVPVLVIFATAALGAFLLYRTPFGRHVVAVGSNEEVARYSGISVNRIRTLTYIIQGACVGIAVIVYVPRIGAATATTGLLWELQAITAVVVGGTALRGGVGRVWGTICGAFILEVVGNIMVLSDFVSEYLIAAVQGAIIIIAMLVQRSLMRRS